MELFFHLELYFEHMCDSVVYKSGHLWVLSKMCRPMVLLPEQSERSTDYLCFFVCLFCFV